jgi:hypothetical protein
MKAAFDAAVITVRGGVGRVLIEASEHVEHCAVPPGPLVIRTGTSRELKRKMKALDIAGTMVEREVAAHPPSFRRRVFGGHCGCLRTATVSRQPSVRCRWRSLVRGVPVARCGADRDRTAGTVTGFKRAHNASYAPVSVAEDFAPRMIRPSGGTDGRVLVRAGSSVDREDWPLHVHQDVDGARLRRVRHRLLLPNDRLLACLDGQRHRYGHHRAEDGTAAARSRRTPRRPRPHSSQRCRQ